MSNITPAAAALRLTRLVTDYGQACHRVGSAADAYAYTGASDRQRAWKSAETERDEAHAQIVALLIETGILL